MSTNNEKPTLKLSPFADYVIECDLRLFGSNEKPLKRSRLINQIIVNYCDDSDIVRRASDVVTENELKTLFRRMNITLTKSQLISFRDSAQISQEKYTYPSESVETRIALSQEALNKLDRYSEDISYAALRNIFRQGDSFSAAHFISALVEEYAALPMYRREAIFYADIMNKAAEAIRRNNDGETCYLFIDTPKSDIKVKIYPVKILLDEWSTYNYLIGIGIYDPEKGETPMCMRMSNINKADIVTSDNILVYHNQQMIDELYRRIKSRGIMFIGSPCYEGEVIRIRLTKNGFDLYNSIVFMRPRYDLIEQLGNGDYIMTFSCTQWQVFNYFKRMGSDVEALEPVQLREKFAGFYRSANELYNDYP